ncbi:hypothetical protein LSH36_166g05078 [Paralvinella palmiformis]|uniref:SOCS box domain-containing protein n=1 Tax=Paralvinella palmiformis TaxID=53620 RepID=A0AAD9JUH7_9ANNE|nr:hypothetical protein LSH36_166g05078 [Paralvinella palmiformis]
MYRRTYWPNDNPKTSPKTYWPTPEEYKKCIDPADVDQEGRTPLHLALLHGGDDDQHLERVIKAGCNINAEDKNGQRAVHYAAQNGHTRCIQKLARHGADLNILDANGYSPLMLSARHGFSKAIRILTRAGANPNLENDRKELAIHYAVCKGHVECLKDLLLAKSKVNHPDAEGCSPLILATKFSWVEVAVTLLNANAAPDHKDNIGKTALHWAATIGNVPMIELLISAGAEIDTFDTYGYSPFVYTIKTNNHVAMKHLLDAGCDRGTVDGLNGTALGLACLRGHQECVKILLETGDDPDEIGFFGLTPLMLACFESHVDVVGTLLEHGANPDAQGRMGATPLVKSLIKICPLNEVPRHRIVALLLRSGADVNLQVNTAGYFTCITKGKNCPLSFAMCSGYTSLIRMLLLAGSQVTCKEVRDWYEQVNIDRFFNTKAIIDPIREWKARPRSLRFSCRGVIRKSIQNKSANISEAIRTLPIAPVLQDFVNFTDLDSIQPERSGLVLSDRLLQGDVHATSEESFTEVSPKAVYP